MEFGLMVEPQLGGSYEELRALALAAEKSGFSSFARSDHYLNGDESVPATDALTSLAGLARETETIMLTVLVTPLTFRHPAVIAKTAITLDEMSGGRFELGIGTGWMEGEHRVFGIQLPEIRKRFSLLFETLAYIHAAMGRTEGGYTGRHHRLEDIEVLPRPISKLPIIIGGSGKKRTPSIAGRFADEYNVFATSRDDLTARLAVMQKTAADQGRDPKEIKVSVMSTAIIGEDEAEYREALGAAASQRGIDPEQLESKLAARRVLHGTYEQAAGIVDDYAADGVGRIYIQQFLPLGEIDSAGLERHLRGIRS
jgi:alkanesulfonate monooxygenase SsuD/methylene tetrahydromethanopterin reductase-like flavin-dependent oxidoreductase (luciferase family)